MTKHYEQLWEECELLTAQSSPSTEQLFAELNTQIQSLQLAAEKDRFIIFGKIIFALCGLSQKYNVNTYTALQKCFNEYKIDWLDPELK